MVSHFPIWMWNFIICSGFIRAAKQLEKFLFILDGNIQYLYLGLVKMVILFFLFSFFEPPWFFNSASFSNVSACQLLPILLSGVSCRDGKKGLTSDAVVENNHLSVSMIGINYSVLFARIYRFLVLLPNHEEFRRENRVLKLWVFLNMGQTKVINLRS